MAMSHDFAELTQALLREGKGKVNDHIIVAFDGKPWNSTTAGFSGSPHSLQKILMPPTVAYRYRILLSL